MGFEPIADAPVSAENARDLVEGAAKASVAVSPPMPADADLQSIIDAWEMLPEAIRAGIVAMVKAANQNRRTTNNPT